MVGKPDVATGNVHRAIVPCNDYEWGLGAMTVMSLTVLWEIENHGVVEHRAVPLR